MFRQRKYSKSSSRRRELVLIFTPLCVQASPVFVVFFFFHPPPPPAPRSCFATLCKRPNLELMGDEERPLKTAPLSVTLSPSQTSALFFFFSLHVFSTLSLSQHSLNSYDLLAGGRRRRRWGGCLAVGGVAAPPLMAPILSSCSPAAHCRAPSHAGERLSGCHR